MAIYAYVQTIPGNTENLQTGSHKPAKLYWQVHSDLHILNWSEAVSQSLNKIHVLWFHKIN